MFTDLIRMFQQEFHRQKYCQLNKLRYLTTDKCWQQKKGHCKVIWNIKVGVVSETETGSETTPTFYSIYLTLTLCCDENKKGSPLC